MAGEAVVSALIDQFIGRVADKLFEEVSLIVDFREDFEFFCDQLIYIKSLLTDAGGMRSSTSASKWLDSLKDFLSEADFMVQECEAEDRVERCVVHHMFGKMIFRCQMGRKIRNLKEKLNKIQENTKHLTYFAAVFEGNARAQALDEDKRERSSALLRELHTVGMEGDLHEAYGMSDRVLSSLKLSYEALPSHLKPCFLYCCVFPKNTQIDTESLVHGWIAEGFVSVQLQDSYNVGLSYMEELIHRCLIEVSEVAGNGRAKSCKMHDLLHDLAVSEQHKSLVKPGGQLERIPVEDCQGLRRISLMKNEISAIEKGIQCPGLQSLFLSHNYGLASISESFFDNMKYLNVLDLSRTSITSLPDSIGNLKRLKYLNVSGTRIDKLPESLSGLQELQFLDVDETYVSDLHSGIEKHTYMLHLNLGRNFKNCPVGISKLIYLQTLNGVTFDLGESRSASALQLRDLKGLTLLQHLSIVFTSNSDDVRVEDEGTFRGMTKMRTLSVQCYGGTNLHLPPDMEAMQRLEIVHLEHCVVPKWIFQLQNLMELSLFGPPKRSSADFRGLENIPNLKKLRLDWNWNRDFIEFPNEFGEAGAFPKLEELVIQGFEHLKSIPSFQEGAMPKLKCLRIMWCKPLENMPEGLTKLRNLKEVEVNMEVDDVEDYERKKMHYWQGLKDRQIKLKGEVWDGAKELRLV